MMDAELANALVEIALLAISYVLAKFHLKNKVKISTIKNALLNLKKAMTDGKLTDNEKQQLLDDVEKMLLQLED